MLRLLRCFGSSLDLTNSVERVGHHYVHIGEHSDLWEGKWSRNSGRSGLVAIKILRGGSSYNQNFQRRLRQNLIRRGRVWRKLKHRHVAVFHGLAYGFGLPALILDFYPNGNITNFTKNGSSNEEKLQLIKEVALGLKFLHKHSVIHGDLRGANILINEERHAVISDHGLAFIIESSEFTSVKTAGNCRWTAPEIMNPSDEVESQPYRPSFTFKSDVFSFAMTIVEVFSGLPPFPQKKNDSAVIFAIIAEKRPELPPYVDESESLTKLVQKCWAAEANERLNADQICIALDVEEEEEEEEPPMSVMSCVSSYLLSCSLF